MGLTVHGLQEGLQRLKSRMPALEVELNAADAKLGDGDTGTMLARLVDTLASAQLEEADLGAAFLALAKTGASSTGSSLGTLVITGLMTAGKFAAGRPEVPWREFGTLISAIRDAAMARGKAVPGNKTVIDSLDYLAKAIADEDDPEALSRKARTGLVAALDDFRPRPCAMGRARMYAEKSMGLDDPGMLAAERLLTGLAEGG